VLAQQLDSINTKMASIIEFPPFEHCELCGIPLRPATRKEIVEDLLDKKYRQMALSSAQGHRDFLPPMEFPEWLKGITYPGSWLMRFDRCGLRALFSNSPPADDPY